MIESSLTSLLVRLDGMDWFIIFGEDVYGREEQVIL